MRIFVTGASGFVGSHLVERLLAQGHAVSALLRKTSDTSLLGASLQQIQTVEGDLDPRAEASPRLLAALGQCDVVIHAGGTTRKTKKTREELFRINEGGTERLAKLCAGLDKPPRLVVTGSIAAVGPSRDGHALTERDPCAPLSAYGQSKLAKEKAAFAHQGKLEVVVVRLPGIYGPRDVNFVQLARTVQRHIRPVGARRVDFAHVHDTCDALLACATHPKAAGQIFHVTSGPLALGEVGKTLARLLGVSAVPLPLPGAVLKPVSLVAEAIGYLSGKPTSLDLDKVREMSESWPVSIAKAKDLLGWEPRVTYEAGARGAIEWARAAGKL